MGLFTYSNIIRMIQFVQAFPDEKIVSTLSTQLGWSHFIEILPLKSPLARQKRMSVGKDDFYLDLLFYHRYLRRLVAIELKLESFKPAHTGQMELYLRWLDKHDRATGEESPIGLILCASADAEQVELLQLDKKSIRVSEYLTELPPIKLLQARLHQAIEHARENSARRLADAGETP